MTQPVEVDEQQVFASLYECLGIEGTYLTKTLQL